MCWGLDFQIETDAVSKVFVIYTANVLARVEYQCDCLTPEFEWKEVSAVKMFASVC